jgi:O-antigen ligase
VAREAGWPRFLRLLGWVALLLLLLTPLVFDPGARDDAFLSPKWAWIAIGTGLAAVALLGRFFSGRPVMFPIDEVWIAALALLAWHWIAVFWAPSRSLAVERASHLSWLTLALWAGMQWLRDRRHLLGLAWGFLALAAITALWVLIEDYVRAFAPRLIWLQPNLPDWRGYLSAGLGNTNHLGDFLALALLVALMLFSETRRRRLVWLLGGCAVLFAAALIVCYSVGSNLGLIGGAALMLGLVLWNGGRRIFLRHWRRWALLLVAWAAVIVYLNLDIPANPHHPGILQEGFGSERWHEGGPTRLAIWAQGLEMVKQHPLRGVGTGNFTYVFPEMDSQLIAGRPDLLAYQGMWTNAAHNELLQAWAELGIGGLFMLIALVGVAFYHLLRNLGYADPLGLRLRIALAGLLACYCLHAQMNFTLQQPMGALIFYGLLLAIIVEKRIRPRVGGRMPPLRWETDWCALQVDWHSMKKPTGLGIALLLPLWAAAGLTVLAGLGWIGLVTHELRPLRAQRLYAQAARAERLGNPAEAEAKLKRALDVWPRAQDVRSHYSEWLVRQHRPQEALEQIKLLRPRLNSNELWLREAQAYDQLGRPADAAHAMAEARKRVWRMRNAG